VDLVQRRDTVARLDLGHALAHRDDVAGDLEAERVRKRDREPRGAVPHIDVDVVHRARAHADERLACPGLGIRHLVVTEDVRRPVLVEADGVH
jgi:hypothetical protein